MCLQLHGGPTQAMSRSSLLSCLHAPGVAQGAERAERSSHAKHIARPGSLRVGLSILLEGACVCVTTDSFSSSRDIYAPFVLARRAGFISPYSGTAAMDVGGNHVCTLVGLTSKCWGTYHVQ